MGPKLPCPRCNTPQNFFERDRVVEDNVEIYVKCSTCRMEKILTTMPEEKYDSYRQIQSLRSKAMKDPHLEKMLNYKIKKSRNG
jgi:hypothetical protein